MGNSKMPQGLKSAGRKVRGWVPKSRKGRGLLGAGVVVGGVYAVRRWLSR